MVSRWLSALAVRQSWQNQGWLDRTIERYANILSVNPGNLSADGPDPAKRQLDALAPQANPVRFKLTAQAMLGNVAYPNSVNVAVEKNALDKHVDAQSFGLADLFRRLIHPNLIRYRSWSQVVTQTPGESLTLT
jgi:hypothetical protein